MQSVIKLTRRFSIISFIVILPCLIYSQSQDQTITPLIQEAERFFALTDYKAAEKTYKQILKKDPQSLVALRGLAAIAFEKKDWGDVKKWQKKIVGINPRDSNANYHLGIAYRKTGKFKVLVLRKVDFNKSKKYFETVIRIDSTFKDILYQRGLLERAKENWVEAIQWGERQVKLKPEMAPAQTGLFKFYRLFLKNEKEQKVLKWLNSRNDDWPLFFLGENNRINERFVKADSIFNKLLNSKLTMSKYPIYLSLMRMRVQQERQIDADHLFEIVLDSIKTHIDAEFLFEDSKYVFTDAEYERFRRFAEPAEKKEFFRIFWMSRNPTPAAQINVRVSEHFKRLVYAEKNYWFDGLRSWFNNPDQVGNLKFPQVFYLNDEFNDKGLIYIRHGEPDDYAVTVAESIPSNESWHYYRREDRPEYIFHFLVGRASGNATGNNWRLAPYITSPAMLGDRLGWHPSIDRLLHARSGLDSRGIIHEMAMEAYSDVRHAMSSDYHSWRNYQPFRTPCYWAFFKGQNNRTRLEIYLGIPVADLSWKSGELKDVIFEHGAGVYDSRLNEIDKEFEQVDLERNGYARLFRDYFIHRYVFELEPAKYNLSYYAQRNEPNKIGGGNFEIQVPNYDTDELNLSDLELAYEVQPVAVNPTFENRELSIIPNPSREFKLSEPITIYFEIYNLAKDKDGDTLFEIEGKLTQTKKKKFLGIFGGERKSLSIKNRIAGHERNIFEHTSFDVNKLEKGEYKLTLKVEDLNSKTKVAKSIDLTLKK